MFCSKCGEKLNDDALFCKRCGVKVSQFSDSSAVQQIQFPQVVYVQAPKFNFARNVVIAMIVAAIAIAIIFGIVMTGNSANELSGRYGNTRFNDGSYGYVIEFKSNGTCLWTQDYSTFSGTYEYVDGEYIINIKGNGLTLSTTFRAERIGDSLYFTGGVFRNSEFVKI